MSIGGIDNIDPDAGRCSRAGCSRVATSRVNWRNPRIHDVDRVKVWLACDEHAPWLRDYLSSRSFPVIISGVQEPVGVVPS